MEVVRDDPLRQIATLEVSSSVRIENVPAPICTLTPTEGHLEAATERKVENKLVQRAQDKSQVGQRANLSGLNPDGPNRAARDGSRIGRKRRFPDCGGGYCGETSNGICATARGDMSSGSEDSDSTGGQTGAGGGAKAVGRARKKYVFVDNRSPWERRSSTIDE